VVPIGSTPCLLKDEGLALPGTRPAGQPANHYTSGLRLVPAHQSGGGRWWPHRCPTFARSMARTLALFNVECSRKLTVAILRVDIVISDTKGSVLFSCALVRHASTRSSATNGKNDEPHPPSSRQPPEPVKFDRNILEVPLITRVQLAWNHGAAADCIHGLCGTCGRVAVLHLRSSRPRQVSCCVTPCLQQLAFQPCDGLNAGQRTGPLAMSLGRGAS
jgi:hypothetical protein